MKNRWLDLCVRLVSMLTLLSFATSLFIMNSDHGRRVVFERLALTSGLAAPLDAALAAAADWRIIIPFSSMLPNLLILGILVAILCIEALSLGWERSSMRRMFIHPSASTRRDILLWGLQIINFMPVLTAFFSLGAVYITGFFVNAVISSATRLDLRIQTGSTIVDIALFVIAFSFFEYWDHRILHTKPFWRLHRIHHTATEMNLITSGRNHPALFAFEPLIRVWVTALLATPPEFLAFWAVFHHVHQMLSHSMLNWDWGWVGRWLVISPVAHQVHHSINPEHYNSNFSNFLTIWDRLFGTWYDGPEKAVEMGLSPEDDDPAIANGPIIRELLIDLKQFLIDLTSFANTVPKAPPSGPPG